MNSSKKSQRSSKKDKNDIILVNTQASSSRSLNKKHGKSKNHKNSSPTPNSQILTSPNHIQSSSSSRKQLLPSNQDHSPCSKPSKKITSSPTTVSILLGFPDGDLSLEDDVDPYLTKIGGVPNWLIALCPASHDLIVCNNCGRDMFLLFQGYVPFEDSVYDRVFYVWGCNQHRCMKRPGSFRALRSHRLNEEYARKNQKKNKPNSSKVDSSLHASTINFDDSSTGGLGGMLFMDGDSSLIGEITTSFESIQDSSMSTWNLAAGSDQKDRGDVESKLCDEITSKLILNPSSQQCPKTSWPEKIPFFPAKYIYIAEEVMKEENSFADLKKYERYLNISMEEENFFVDDENDDWSGEKYEKSRLPKGVDKAFKRFSERVNEWPEQCIRYEFDGQPLLYNQSDSTASLLLSPPYGSVKQLKTTTHQLPKCPKCGSRRAFEFQLMPSLLCVLPIGEYSSDTQSNAASNNGISQFDVGMEWGTIMIFTCSQDCNLDGVGDDGVSYYEELVLVQYEE
ncbi:5661_t:CDS:2 [Acaulospora morrowiae]|uniref:5661_t:CDS:1 n=1 Tax=Acaulospora morrowiae TaxID=94023 RepID=A0A9N8ZH70_9GLOM|nr:5661_t:CDS:2 [Acaulospora morrowiae]